MFKLCGILTLAALATSVVAFDTSNFFTSQINLLNGANVFGADTYDAVSVDPSQLGAIASHIKACSDLYDAAIISVAAISPLQFPDAEHDLPPTHAATHPGKPQPPPARKRFLPERERYPALPDELLPLGHHARAGACCVLGYPHCEWSGGFSSRCGASSRRMRLASTISG
ncbi:hypothetical protein C8R46DRAFT_1148896 [Mycena filopes]|nr:hypothetical protein C8R46DRAFT_1148896 [Mycena filopes]